MVCLVNDLGVVLQLLPGEHFMAEEEALSSWTSMSVFLALSKIILLGEERSGGDITPSSGY